MKRCKQLMNGLTSLAVFCIFSFSSLSQAATIDVELKNESDEMSYSINYMSAQPHISAYQKTYQLYLIFLQSVMSNEQVIKGIVDTLDNNLVLAEDTEYLNQISGALTKIGFTSTSEGVLWQGRRFEELTEQDVADFKKAVEQALQSPELQQKLYYWGHVSAIAEKETAEKGNKILEIRESELVLNPKIMVRASLDAITGQTPLLPLEKIQLLDNKARNLTSLRPNHQEPSSQAQAPAHNH